MTGPESQTSPRFDAVVVGAGPTGLATALALERLGLGVALTAAPHRPVAGGPDNRTAALFAGSIDLLENLEVWRDVAPLSEPLVAIRIIDDTNALLRAPEVLFHAADIGRDHLGFNVPNAALVDALMQAVRARPITIVETAGVETLESEANHVRLKLKDGAALEARLVAGADGRNSICRSAAGIGTSSWSYPQSALTCIFEHSRPHGQVSTEFHRDKGPFTVVPMPGLASSLVWVDSPADLERHALLDDGAFRTLLERRLDGLLGSIGAVGQRSLFPLSGLTADRFGANRVALIGEAGHVIPPIGAQGLNLGLRDAATLADQVADALATGHDIGGADVLSAYSAARRPDIQSRVWTVDLLNRSLIFGYLPVSLARGAGLHLLKAVAPLRRLVMSEGVAPSYASPSLMRPGGLDRLALRKRRQQEPSATA